MGKFFIGTDEQIGKYAVDISRGESEMNVGSLTTKILARFGHPRPYGFHPRVYAIVARLIKQGVFEITPDSTSRNKIIRLKGGVGESGQDEKIDVGEGDTIQEERNIQTLSKGDLLLKIVYVQKEKHGGSIIGAQICKMAMALSGAEVKKPAKSWYKALNKLSVDGFLTTKRRSEKSSIKYYELTEAGRKFFLAQREKQCEEVNPIKVIPRAETRAPNSIVAAIEENTAHLTALTNVVVVLAKHVHVQSAQHSKSEGLIQKLFCKFEDIDKRLASIELAQREFSELCSSRATGDELAKASRELFAKINDSAGVFADLRSARERLVDAISPDRYLNEDIIHTRAEDVASKITDQTFDIGKQEDGREEVVSQAALDNDMEFMMMQSYESRKR